jgi:hypothetical protein
MNFPEASDMKKINAFKTIPAIIFTAAALSGVTFGYLTDGTDIKFNEFYPGVLTASIYENGGFAPDNINIIQPDNQTALKQVHVTNVSNPHETDCYIRVMLVPVFRTDEGTLAADITLSPDGSDVEVRTSEGEEAVLHLAGGWQHDWIYDGGYYYYKHIVHPGESTQTLLNNVTVSDEELWDSFRIEVISDAVQAENGAANNAWGGIADQLD